MPWDLLVVPGVLTWPPERERGGERGSTPSLPMVLHHGLVGRGWVGWGGGERMNGIHLLGSGRKGII